METTIQINKELKLEFEKKFKELHGVKPSTSEYLENVLTKKIEGLDQELAARQAAEAEEKK